MPQNWPPRGLAAAMTVCAAIVPLVSVERNHKPTGRHVRVQQVEESGQTAAVLTVTAVGDLRITRRLIRKQSREIRKIRLQGDVVFANFEGVLAETNPAPWKFDMPVETMPVLRKMGVNTISLANNHSLNLGEQGYLATSRRLTQAGFWVAEVAAPGTVMQIK